MKKSVSHAPFFPFIDKINIFKKGRVMLIWRYFNYCLKIGVVLVVQKLLNFVSEMSNLIEIEKIIF